MLTKIYNMQHCILRDHETCNFRVSYPFSLTGSNSASFTGKLMDCFKKNPTQKVEKIKSILFHQKKMGPTLCCYDK